MKRLFLLVSLGSLLAMLPARADEIEDQYLRIYTLIQEADSLSVGGQPSQALAKYTEAQTALRGFQKGYPGWNARVVNFRLNYLAGKIADVSPKVPAAAARPAPAAAPAGVAPAHQHCRVQHPGARPASGGRPPR